MPSYQYRDAHSKDETVLRLYHGNPQSYKDGNHSKTGPRYYPTLVWSGHAWTDVAYNTTMTRMGQTSDFEVLEDTPYVVFTLGCLLMLFRIKTCNSWRLSWFFDIKINTRLTFFRCHENWYSYTIWRKGKASQPQYPTTITEFRLKFCTDAQTHTYRTR